MAAKPKNVSDEGDIGPTFDPMVLEHVSPVSALYFLSRQRLLSLLEALDESGLKGDEDAGKLVGYSAVKLINPLLLASAVSISIVRKHDYQSLLTDYVRGLSPDFDKYLLKVPEFASQKESERFLEIEEDYVQALHLLPLQLMLPNIATAFANLQIPKPRPTIPTMQWLKFLLLPELIASQQSNSEMNHSLNSAKEILVQPDPSPFHIKSLSENW